MQQVVFGQIESSRREDDLEKLVLKLQEWGWDVKIRPVLVHPLSWAINIDLDDDVLLARTDRDVLDLFQKIGQYFGDGNYYFRGVKTDLVNFWDTIQMPFFGKPFNGIPLSVRIHGKSIIFCIHFSWVTEFLNMNCSKPFSPIREEREHNNGFRIMLRCLARLTCVKGDWQFHILHDGINLPFLSPASSVSLSANKAVN